MNRFSINLATRPFHNNTLYWVGLVACILFLSGFTWYNVDLYAGAGHDMDRWNQALTDHRQAITDLDREVDTMRRRVERLDLVALSERSAFANEIILSRLFSWTSLFDRLEEVMPPKVRLRSIRPAVGREMIEITVDGMTPNPEALLEFEEGLIRSKYFNFVYPVHESSRVKQGEINFSLTFGYLPEGRSGEVVEDPAAQAVPAVEEAAGEIPEAPGGAEEAVTREPDQASPAGQEPAGGEAPAAEQEPAGAEGGGAPEVVDLDSIEPETGDPDPNEGDPNDEEDPNDSVDEDDEGDEGGGAAP